MRDTLIQHLRPIGANRVLCITLARITVTIAAIKSEFEHVEGAHNSHVTLYISGNQAT